MGISMKSSSQTEHPTQAIQEQLDINTNCKFGKILPITTKEVLLESFTLCE